jgi:hypothetical protein
MPFHKREGACRVLQRVFPFNYMGIYHVRGYIP